MNLNPTTQTALQKILDDYAKGKRRFEYDEYSQFNKRTFYLAMYNLKNKTGSHLIRKSKAYYIHSDLVYELVDDDTVAKPIDLPRISPQSNRKSYHLQPE